MNRIGESIIFKSIFGIVLVLIVFTGIICAIGYNGVSGALLEQYSADAYQTARVAASKVDGDRIDAYEKSGGKTDEYQKVIGDLDVLCNESGSMFIYIIQPDLTDYGHIKFLFSTVNKDSRFTRFDFGYVRETTNDDYKMKYDWLYTGEREQALVVRDIGYIETDPHITAMVPIKDSEGKTQAILCVQKQMDVLSKSRSDFTESVLGALIILTLIIVICQAVFLYTVLFRPIRTVTMEAERFARENVKAAKKLKEDINTADEVGKLADSIDKMEEQITDYVVNLKAVTAENERIATELSLATTIQTGMLPSNFAALPEKEEFEIFASMVPAREVGGDFYDFFLVDDNHLGLVIADVSGKGVPAALYMMSSMIQIKTNAKMGKSPAKLLEDVNNSLCTQNDEMFVTVWVGILDLCTGIMKAANAGHEYPAVTGEDGRFELLKDKHGFVLGGMEGMKYSEYEIRMTEGSKVFVYTDGIAEATDDKAAMYGTDRLLEALNEEPDASPETLINTVKESVDRFVDEAEQFDDLTMLCIEYKHGRHIEGDEK